MHSPHLHVCAGVCVCVNPTVLTSRCMRVKIIRVCVCVCVCVCVRVNPLKYSSRVWINSLYSNDISTPFPAPEHLDLSAPMGRASRTPRYTSTEQVQGEYAAGTVGTEYSPHATHNTRRDAESAHVRSSSSGAVRTGTHSVPL